MLQVTGYVYKLAKSNTLEKGAKFIITQNQDGQQPRILRWIPINAYTSLPSYNPLILFTLEVHESLAPDTNLYDVYRIVRCQKRFDQRGIPGHVLQKFLGFREPIHNLPLRIRYESDIVTYITAGPLRDRLLTLCRPWFRGECFYDLLRYFPENFLLRLSEDEVFYLYCACLARPYFPCFRPLLERCLQNPVAVPHEGGEKVIFGDHHGSLLGGDRSYITDPYKVKKLTSLAPPIYFDTSQPMWSPYKYKLFSKDHERELAELSGNDESLHAAFQISEALITFMSCERETFRNGHVCFSYKQVCQKGHEVLEFLISEELLKPDCLADPNIPTPQYIYPEAEMQELSFVRWLLETQSQVEVYDLDLDAEGFYDYFHRKIAAPKCSKGRTLILCNSFITASEYTWKRALTAYHVGNWLGMMEDDEKQALDSCKGLQNLIFLRAHKISLATITRAIQEVAKARGDSETHPMNVYFVGTSNERVTSVSSCFRELSDNLKKHYVVDMQDGEYSEIKLFKHIELQKIGKLHITNYATEDQGIRMLYRWSDLKPNKHWKKQIFCSSEEMKRTLLKHIYGKQELYYGPGRLFLDHKVCVPSLGFTGTLKAAKKYTSYDTWLPVTDKRTPLLTLSSPYELVLENRYYDKVVKINTADHPCVPSEVETISRYPDEMVDVGMFFVDKTTSQVDLIQAAKLCKVDLHIYKSRTFNLPSVFNQRDFHLPTNCLAPKIRRFLQR